ncbi:STAS domain-containing protein [Streptomyces sp. NBC_00582]|uniref:STAS domain-containing protein n=1 Tax=Streptomyces sp. NBC_00582 TaxID=2975783 RepID=UPI00106261EF|nr:STAS domain-containing protein [Streptomyces sp. NBC_00582]WUB60029.1 STAS domain-containing protein [Streptomyces sp. NBC_00582]
MTPPATPPARTRVNGPYTVVELAGEIDLATAGSVADHLDAATASAAVDVLVDLRGVEFFDCSGLRVLCRAQDRAVRGGGRLRIVCDQPYLRRLLGATGLLGRFPPLASLPDGLPDRTP